MCVCGGGVLSDKFAHTAALSTRADEPTSVSSSIQLSVPPPTKVQAGWLVSSDATFHLTID